MSIVCGPVVVVTTMVDDEPAGTTVSAFSALSLRPPLAMLALDRTSRLLRKIETSERLGINVLGEGQEDLAMAFATKRLDKFDGVRWSARNGLPCLHGAPGWAACSVTARIPGGDHIIVVAGVEDIEFSEDVAPLVYGGRRFGTHSALSNLNPAVGQI